MEAIACDVFLSIGTSLAVYPAAGLLAEARARGALTVEINTEQTAASQSVDISIQEPAEEALERLDGLLG